MAIYNLAKMEIYKIPVFLKAYIFIGFSLLRKFYWKILNRKIFKISNFHHIFIYNFSNYILIQIAQIIYLFK